MDKIAQRLKAYIDTHPIDLGDSDCETVLDQLFTKPMQNPTNPTQQKSVTDSKNWKNSSAPFRWKITTLSLTSVAVCAVPTNGNPFWMACNMVRNSCRRLSTHDIRNALLRHSSLIKK